jgi:hypothetical protein
MGRLRCRTGEAVPPRRTRRNPQQSLFNYFESVVLSDALKPYAGEPRFVIPSLAKLPVWSLENGKVNINLGYSLRRPDAGTHVPTIRFSSDAFPNKKIVKVMEKVADATRFPVLASVFTKDGSEAFFSSKWARGGDYTDYRRGKFRAIGEWLYVPGLPPSDKTTYKAVVRVLSLKTDRPSMIEKQVARELAKYHFPHVPEAYQEAVASLLMEAYESDDRAIYTQAKELAALVAE